jgi:hypothetical protein
MSTAALIVLFLVLALIVSAGVAIPRAQRNDVADVPENPDGEVESELLRRPLRSRHPV